MRPATKRRLKEMGNTALTIGGGALAVGTAAVFLTPSGAPVWLPVAFKILGYVGGGVTAGGLLCHTADMLVRQRGNLA